MNQPHTGVFQAAILVHHVFEYGVRNVVVCPGSRNAPIIHELVAHGGFQITSVVDERNAGYQAIGISIATNRAPVMVVTTSGTAALNLSSSLAEADLLDIPIIAVTADRPKEWIGQQDNQAINQNRIFSNFVRFETELMVDEDGSLAWYHAQQIAECFTKAQFPRKGPVHINVPIREPLYVPQEHSVKLPLFQKIVFPVLECSVLEFQKYFHQANKILLVIGQGLDHPAEEIKKWAELPQVFIFHERLANLNLYTDWRSEAAAANITKEMLPDLVIYWGGPIVSKRIKTWLRTLEVPFYSIGTTYFPNTFQKSITRFVGSTKNILSQLIPIKKESSFSQIWQKAGQLSLEVGEHWEDTFIYSEFSEVLTGEWIHWGNSSVIRFANYQIKKGQQEWSNRGSSGIDGVLSTAVGCAQMGQKTDLIIGDISMAYNLNGLWQEHHHIPLRIWVINNGGGQIFDLLSGPEQFPEAKKLQTTPQQLSFEFLAKGFGAAYRKITSKASWEILKNEMETISWDSIQVIELDFTL
jgi:2-succinyl-5-enolpyruvyl-6-hydroxy-3-cyclohexene-1-carboxylate synthase